MKDILQTQKRCRGVLRCVLGLLLGLSAASAWPNHGADARVEEAAARRLLLRLDTNKDGYLSPVEAARAMELSHRFMEIDANRDGQLSVGELTPLAVLHRQT